MYKYKHDATAKKMKRRKNMSIIGVIAGIALYVLAFSIPFADKTRQDYNL